MSDQASVSSAPAAPAASARRRWWRWWRFPRVRRYFGRFSLPGLTGALLFYCLSLTPSLLPRVWYLQAVMSGITMVIGYIVGIFVGWLLRSLISWQPPRALRLAGGWTLLAATIVLVPLFGYLGADWQHQIRNLVDASQPSETRYIFVVLVSVLVFAAVVGIGWGIRSLVRVTARPLRRVFPRQAATALAVLIVVLILGFLFTDALPRLAVSGANSVFGNIDNGTAPGISEPITALRSGGPSSLVPWLTLGRQGRTFVDTGPTQAEISKFTDRPAMEPIRVYVGLRSTDSIAAESALAVRELERTGAFNRKVIVVATTTGTGWLNPAMIDPLEYMYNGDTAVVATQYSYLPSWISFLVDKAPAQAAGQDLFDAVYAKWLELPPEHRPKLVVFGESLGSFGGEAAFSGTYDIRDRTSGVLWVGPTNGNTLWSRFTAARDPRSPEWRPVYEGGRTVRFATTPVQLSPTAPVSPSSSSSSSPSSSAAAPVSPSSSAAAGSRWDHPRVVYLQNPSDPIVWWSWGLAFHQPDWLRDTRPPDVSSAMHWYPLVTFWQVAGDLALATAVPPGYGHTYGMEQGTAAWAAILPPPGWTPQRTDSLGARRAN